MENRNLFNRIKEMIQEDGMVANAPGGSGGFSGSSAVKGPTAGFDPVIKPMRKRYIYQKGLRKNWKKKEDNG
tara:strand:+ start:1015 stop:1230 length:216 start_codon:yes stop_codon:yes gene_type:complete